MFISSFTSFFVKETDGYFAFTKSGIIVMIILAVAIVIAGILLAKKLKDDSDDVEEASSSKSKKLSGFGTKKLVVCAMCLALGYVCSTIKFLELFNGGSITLFSMLFITYIGYCFGVKTGILCGLAYGILQLIQDPWLLSPLQVCFDYIFAFAALGLSGIFRNIKDKNKETGEKRLSKKGLIIGYAVAAICRGISHSIGGYMFWMDGMPESFPKALAWLYPVAYNFCYIGVEMLITIVLLLIPGVAAILIRLRREANS
ncbi:MAG: energy-coupled thiamine transporter ThiT [Lachnospiraceae bacterium]|nr:energy-coupled thiamine transporter ThiT [Lachnospiraceae bacterium]